MKKGLKWFLWGVLVIALVAAYAYSATRPLQADLLEIEPRTIEKTFTESGMVSATWKKDFFSLIGGKVLEVYVEEGDQLAGGETLLVLDTQDIRYQISQLQGQLTSIRGQERQALSGTPEEYTGSIAPAIEQVEIQLAAAREDYERLQTLYQSGAVSQTTMEEAERGVRQLEILLTQQKQLLQGAREQFSGLEASLRAQIAMLQYQLENARMVAPESSTVSTVHVKKGAVVAQGTPLLSIFRQGEYEVEVFLLAEDVIFIQPGMEVRVAYKGLRGDEYFQGTVSKIATTAEERISTLGLSEQRVKVNIRLSGDVSHLRSGYSMDVIFITHREDDKLAVPKTSLFTYEDMDALWVVREGRAEIQQVEKGLETDDEVVIVSGLAAGDLVIRNTRLEGLKPGVRIEQP